MFKATDEKKDPHLPPFFGGDYFDYQVPLLGAFTRQLGSAVADYLYYSPHFDIIIRLQTDRFHSGLGPAQQGSDVLQRAELNKRGIVIDVWEGGFVDADPNVARPYDSDVVLQAACAIAKDAISLRERGSEIYLGVSQARG